MSPVLCKRIAGIIIGFFTLFTIVSCNHRSKSDFKNSFELKEKLYVENYRAGLIGNLTSKYVIDSTTFRLHLGIYDDEREFIYVKNSGDSLVVEKKLNNVEAASKGVTVLIEKRIFSMKALSNSHEMD